MFPSIGIIILALKAKAAAWWAGASGRLLLYGAIAVGAVIAAGFIYSLGASSERGKCNVAALRSQIATLQRDLGAARAAAADDKAKAIKLDALAVEQARKLTEYENALKTRPDRCVLRDDDVIRLR
jgi:hypothetical protein